MYPSVQQLCYFPGFNRYMVECESKICFFQFLDEISFNRYMVECEYDYISCSRLCKWVLIDTWWNVNIHNYDSNIHRINVLIDTWWNVNFI